MVSFARVRFPDTVVKIYSEAFIDTALVNVEGGLTEIFRYIPWAHEGD